MSDREYGAEAAESWKLTLPCTREEAEALHGDIAALAMLDPVPVLMTSEPDPDRPEAWQLEAYFEGEPDKAVVKLVQSLIPSAKKAKPVLEKLPQEDWLTMSQQGLEPVVAGRFHVRNSADDPVPSGPAAHGLVHYLIPAGRAFGTGQHETTTGCLMMLDRVKRLGGRFDNICDVGTGTGLLAFAAMHLWPRCYAMASDIDPVSIEVTAENAVLNRVPLGRGQGRLALAVAAGVDHGDIVARAPYDLVIANILAGPLIELAPSLSAMLEEGGTMILAGLLDKQMENVLAAYRREGMRLADRIDNGPWPTLRLRKRASHGWKRPRRREEGRNGEAPGFGSW